ncbi:Sb55 (modular protein) [Xenorhabdus bovienii str. Jollieti]|uniref:Sb55 (Modular protein) n=1 Tax=Xenorhabdus bovienii (strain SS-2004) TaxID=406818 RepID=D3UZI4_XENBS|nr:hypothetical protein [Xenorhabdus bovienii]CBJ79827.1 Sb55 (modular protein) [Xenorhabdus bovienii SS-2004]CBJ83076.1 Sb55 (modular protein) [Xenorhabdus bovienii SS-2004]CDH29341.1 Sb55 (modular protein) [Xenorhabdus bovienii str. Jollieti]
MTELNYEAIGRCKVLREKIEALHTRRHQCVYKLRDETSRLTFSDGYRIPEIAEFDRDLMQSQMKDIALVDSDLMHAVHEFNIWCQEAGEPSIKLNPSTKKDLEKLKPLPFDGFPGSALLRR